MITLEQIREFLLGHGFDPKDVKSVKFEHGAFEVEVMVRDTEGRPQTVERYGERDFEFRTERKPWLPIVVSPDAEAGLS